VKVRKECVDMFVRFSLESLEEISLNLYQQKFKYSTKLCKVCAG
jgi:hypothetical protein